MTTAHPAPPPKKLAGLPCFACLHVAESPSGSGRLTKFVLPCLTRLGWAAVGERGVADGWGATASTGRRQRAALKAAPGIIMGIGTPNANAGLIIIWLCMSTCGGSRGAAAGRPAWLALTSDDTPVSTSLTGLGSISSSKRSAKSLGNAAQQERGRQGGT